jgi:hypothetical protein
MVLWYELSIRMLIVCVVKRKDDDDSEIIKVNIEFGKLLSGKEDE